MRLKPVTVNRIAGTSVSPPISSRIWTAFEELTFTGAPSVADGQPAQTLIIRSSGLSVESKVSSSSGRSIPAAMASSSV